MLAPSTGSSGSQQGKVDRGSIAVLATSILSQFWVSEDEPDEVRAFQLRGWLDVLDGIARDEVRAAWAEYQKTGARSKLGVLYRPDAGAIYKLVMEARANAARMRPKPPPAPELPKPPPVSMERRLEIMREAGWGDRDPAEIEADLARKKKVFRP
jgi:hypothetical protein